MGCELKVLVFRFRVWGWEMKNTWQDQYSKSSPSFQLGDYVTKCWMHCWWLSHQWTQVMMFNNVVGDWWQKINVVFNPSCYKLQITFQENESKYTKNTNFKLLLWSLICFTLPSSSLFQVNCSFSSIFHQMP
jgi:hypothetical protein